jgi:Fanconi anemia group M protein
MADVKGESKGLPDEKGALAKDGPLVQIVIDERESKEYDLLLEKLGAKVTRQTLTVADFVLSERVAAERKSRADFEASIIDGRLFEQAARLAGTYPRAVMIVEGERGDGRSERIGRSALLGAYSALMAEWGISIFFTKSAEGTVELLMALARYEQVNKDRPMRVMAKAKSLTLEAYQRAVVEVLPGVGPKMAKELLDYFGSPANVMAADEKKLQEVARMGPKKAKMIRRVLDSGYERKEE